MSGLMCRRAAGFRRQGFTLFELMTSIAILGILTTLAVPSYRVFIVDSRLSAQTNLFLAALNLARSEAVKRNSTVTVQAKAATWSSGWRVLDETGALLRDFPALNGGNTLVSATASTALVFRSSGQMQGGGNAHFNLCTDDSGSSRSIVIGAAGHASAHRPGQCGA